MDETAVVNASPLIYLSKGGYLDLLKEVARNVIVPEAVATEIRARGERDATVRTLAAAEWIGIEPCPEVPPAIWRWGLGSGESAVLALAMRMNDAVAVIDDLAGRRCASSLDIPVRGTLGIILHLKKRGRLSEARPVLERLIQNGMYLSKGVVDEALKRVGE